MANLETIIDALEEDITVKIIQIAPRTNPDKRFKEMRIFEGEPPSGKIRGFYLNWGEAEQVTIGSAARTYKLPVDVVVGYPLEKWQVARIADTDQINRAFGQSAGQTSITGISFRLADPESPPETETTEDWIWKRFHLLSMIETTE